MPSPAPVRAATSSPSCQWRSRSCSVAAELDGKHLDEPVPHVNRYDVPENRIDITLDDGGVSSLWWATKNEWLGLIDVSGLELEALYGGFEGEPLSNEAGEYVFVTRR